jgi:hypothetical protein
LTPLDERSGAGFYSSARLCQALSLSVDSAAFFASTDLALQSFRAIFYELKRISEQNQLLGCIFDSI